MHVLMIPVGSGGDVHPFVGVGVRLAERGHRVAVICNEHFRSLVEGAGLEFVRNGTEEQYRAAIEDPDLWTPRKGLEVFARHAVIPALRPMYETIKERYVPGETVVVAAGFAYGARIAHDKLGVPLVTIHLQPTMLRSEHEASLMSGLSSIARMPRLGKRLTFYLIDRLLADKILGPATNAFRAELGLPPVRRFLHQWWHSPQRVIGLFPEWYGPPQPDWPPQTRLTGFPLYDAQGVEEIPPGVSEFLDAGDPPIVFSPGTAMRQGAKFFESAVEACRILGRRGMLLTLDPSQLPDELPEGVAHFDYVPFSQVLPRAAALVHHGGMGTAAQAMAAGIPHLITPYAADQTDNAARLERMGVARKADPRTDDGAAFARKLRQLLESEQARAQCRLLADRIRNADPLPETCDLIEEMAGRDVVVR